MLGFSINFSFSIPLSLDLKRQRDDATTSHDNTNSMPNTEQETASLEREEQQYSDHEVAVIPVQHATVDVNNQSEEEIPCFTLEFEDLQNLDFNENDLFIDSTITEKIIHCDDLIETQTRQQWKSRMMVHCQKSLRRYQIFNVDSSLLESATNNSLHQPTTLVDRETAPKSTSMFME